MSVLLRATYFVVEYLILVLQTGHEGVLCEIIMARAVLRVCALDLLIQSLYIAWQQAMEFERVALLSFKRRTFVEIGSPKKCVALIIVLVSAFRLWWHSTTVNDVSWAPEVDRAKCPNLLLACKSDLDHILPLHCCPM